jgi:hypothetical protein
MDSRRRSAAFTIGRIWYSSGWMGGWRFFSMMRIASAIISGTRSAVIQRRLVQFSNASDAASDTLDVDAPASQLGRQPRILSLPIHES